MTIAGGRKGEWILCTLCQCTILTQTPCLLQKIIVAVEEFENPVSDKRNHGECAGNAQTHQIQNEWSLEEGFSKE